MAKFVFSLQSILNLKVRLEEQQELSFAAARKRLDEEEEKLKALYDRKTHYEEEARELREKKLVIQDILDSEMSLIRIKEFIAEQERNVRICEENLEAERLKLVEAMKERKTYEKLRENAFEEYKKEMLHEEGVENDEHNSFVYGQKAVN